MPGGNWSNLERLRCAYLSDSLDGFTGIGDQERVRGKDIGCGELDLAVACAWWRVMNGRSIGIKHFVPTSCNLACMQVLGSTMRPS